MTQDEVLSRAQAIAEQEGWTWRKPVKAWQQRSWWLLGRRKWVVMSNANYIGRNVWIYFDDETGELISKSYMPR